MFVKVSLRNFSIFLVCVLVSSCDTLKVEILQKEGVRMTKVMLLAPEEVCDRLRDVLENKYILLPCSDTCIAKEILIAKPDILILSLNLPGSSGLTFLKENRNSLPPKVIVLTAFCSCDILSDLAALGVFSVIRIPFKNSYLEQQL